jgi:hypothetical protein
LGGAIFIIALVVGVWFCSRRGNSQSKARTDAEIPGSIFVPSGSVPPLASAGVKKAFGRAELGGEKGGVVEVVSPISAQDGVSPVGGEEVRRGPGRAGLEGRYGLRPEELDSEGRYVGELHGDGRQGHYGGGVELEGSEVLR